MPEPLTVILPAAGLGTRLSLPYPKELFRTDGENASIDLSFQIFDKVSTHDVNFVVIINENKTEIVKYLSR